MTGEPQSTGLRISHWTHLIVCASIIGGAVFVTTVQNGEHGVHLARARRQMEGMRNAEPVTSPAELLKQQRLRKHGQDDGAEPVAGASEGLRRQVEEETHVGALGAGEGSGHASNSRACDCQQSIAEKDMCPGGHKVVTVSTTHNDRLCMAVYTALWHGISLKVIGYGGPFRINLDKAYYMMSELSRLPPDCVVTFTDNDAMFLSDSDTILEKYRALGSPKTLVSAECMCWPWGFDVVNKPEVCKTFPPSPTSYRYLNSGFIMGRAGDLLPLYLRQFEYPLQELDLPRSDQERLSRIFLSEPKYGVQLDYYANISLPMAAARPIDLYPYHCPTFAALEMDATTQSYHNNFTGNKPSILHFNGEAHKPMEGFWRQHVEQVKAAMGEDGVNDKIREILETPVEMGYAMRRFGDVCGNWVKSSVQGVTRYSGTPVGMSDAIHTSVTSVARALHDMSYSQSQRGVRDDNVPFYLKHQSKEERESAFVSLMHAEQKRLSRNRRKKGGSEEPVNNQEDEGVNKLRS